MKVILTLSLLTLFVACTSNQPSAKNQKPEKQTEKKQLVIKRNSPKELTETIIQTFIDNDIESFGELMYTKQDIEETIKLYTTDSATIEKEYKKQIQYYDSNMIKVNMAWRSCRKQMTAQQIDWNDVKIVKLDARVIQDPEVPITRTDMTITIQSKYVEFTILVPNCSKVEKEWTLSYPPKLMSFRSVSPK